jgi:predicted amidophosphoribosyltransferase
MSRLNNIWHETSPYKEIWQSKTGGRKLTKKSKHGFDYYYLYKYYPVRFEVKKKYQKIRQLIWDFKDGIGTKKVAKKMIPMIYYLGAGDPLGPEFTLCIIPASTKEKTTMRFKRFCKVCCKDQMFSNGYNKIKNRKDRAARHLSDDRASDDIIKNLKFGDIEDQVVILFDDVYTTGASFVSIARKLKKRGAIDVIGLFLGKTHWLDYE